MQGMRQGDVKQRPLVLKNWSTCTVSKVMFLPAACQCLPAQAHPASQPDLRSRPDRGGCGELEGSPQSKPGPAWPTDCPR
eukprot:3648411-Lingulodinium_polyedra.AAC.1